ncbi:MAG: chromate efflux transporter [Oceanospirillaceae bacterium]
MNTVEMVNTTANSAKQVSLTKLFQVFLKIGLLSFGGPAAQISLMHKVLVDENNWLSEQQYLNALGFCMLLPGPEAMQLATYAGWRLRGILGGLVAGLLFVIPGAIVILLLASLYTLYAGATFNDVAIIDTLFLGVKAAVLIIVFEALIKVSKRALKATVHWIIAALAFIGIFLLSIPFPLIILMAALYGFFAIKPAKTNSQDIPTTAHNNKLQHSLRKTLAIIVIGVGLWFLPILIIEQFTDLAILSDIARFFSKLAVVTFGGAYAVLVYMTQDVVTQFGWLTAGEMMDALGLAETTPGPLILVTQFVGFIAAFNQGGYWLAVAASAITLWVTFVPCFIWVFVGAPYIEWMHSQQRLSAAFSAITAAVVGVILNLSIWFALHLLFKKVSEQTWPLIPSLNLHLTLWQPQLSSIDWRIVFLTAVCAVLFFYKRVGVLQVLLISSLLGWGLVSFSS